MPIYEYKCTSCGMTYDILHKRSEIMEDVICPSCNSTSHKKLMSTPNIAGSGSVSSEASCDTGDCCGGACGMN